METGFNEVTITERMCVGPKIRLLNKYIQRVQKVAVHGIQPVYSENNHLTAFEVAVEGTPATMNYLKRLIAADSNLRAS